MAETIKSLPAYAGKLPKALTGEAARLSEVLPHLVVEARNVSAQLQLGIHGRRRAGPGEEFWEFRPFSTGESVARIDWRRSARDDRLYVREREWQSASTYWLWVDLSPSMHFTSGAPSRPKRDRALVIGLALADILVHAGERAGLLGRTPPMATRSIIARMADALLRQSPGNQLPEKMIVEPEVKALRRQDHLVLIGDFIMPPAEFEQWLAKVGKQGARGTIVLIRDPAEESFPFSGEMEFEGLENNDLWRVGDADEVAIRYRERIRIVNDELRRIAIRHGFGFVRHVTDRPPAQTLLALAAIIGGQASAFPANDTAGMAGKNLTGGPA